MPRATPRTTLVLDKPQVPAGADANDPLSLKGNGMSESSFGSDAALFIGRTWRFGATSFTLAADSLPARDPDESLNSLIDRRAAAVRKADNSNVRLRRGLLALGGGNSVARRP